VTTSARCRKAALRRELLARRRALSSAACRRAGSAISRRLQELPQCRVAAAVHTYVDSLPNEVPTRPFIAWCLARGKRVIVPVVRGRRPPMAHAEIHRLEELQPSPMGLLQPDPEGARWWAPEEDVDLIIVPAVAFDRRGYRIGHGGGFYDAFLASCPGVLTVGLAYDALVIDEVPVEEHDRAVDQVVTETTSYGDPR